MKNISIWFKGLRGKLLFQTLFPVALLAIISTISLRGIKDLSNELSNAGSVRAPMIRLTGEMNSSLNATFRWLWATYQAEAVEARNSTLEKAKSEFKAFEQAQADYISLPLSAKDIEMYQPVKENWSKAHDIIQEAMSLLAKHDKVSNAAAREVLVVKLRPVLAPITQAYDAISVYRQEAIKQNITDNAAFAAKIELLSIVFSLSGAILLFFIGFLLAKNLSSTLDNITTKIYDSGMQVTAASTQLSTASQQLSAGATEAASSLEETVASLEELASMVKLNADNAKEASSLSHSSRDSAGQGEAEIQQLISAMNEISMSSKKIEEIINVIDDIAFQTNLLALNAAVEAARAGEQGKGFAVVAEAVRNLAQRSGSAAKEITTLIKESVAKIDNGSKIADRSGTVLKEIVTSVKKVADLNNEISSASREQSTGLDQISKAMNELDQATQGNASSAEEVAASSEEMSAQALALQDLVRELTLVVNGNSEKSYSASETAFKTSSAANKAATATNIIKIQPNAKLAAEKVIPFELEQVDGKISNTSGF